MSATDTSIECLSKPRQTGPVSQLWTESSLRESPPRSIRKRENPTTPTATLHKN